MMILIRDRNSNVHVEFFKKKKTKIGISVLLFLYTSDLSQNVGLSTPPLNLVGLKSTSGTNIGPHSNTYLSVPGTPLLVQLAEIRVHYGIIRCI